MIKAFKVSNLTIYLFLLLVCFLIYFNSLNNDFLFDDHHLIINNIYIKQAKFIPRILTVDFFHFVPFNPVAYYRPVPILTHALEYKVWKLNPFGYHLTNILIHSSNSYFVYYLIFLLFGNIILALASSILFAINPVQHTTVSLIFNRSELLLLSFMIISIINYLLFMRASKIKNYILCIIFFSLALFTKENAILLLPLLFLCVYLGSGLKKDKLKYFLPFIAIYLMYIYFRLFWIKIPFPQYPPSPFNLGFISEFANFLNIIMHYLSLLIFPLGLYYHRGITPILIYSRQAILAFVFWLFIGGLFLWGIKNKKKILWWGMAWFILSISFVIKSMHTFGFLQLAMMEHWIYLASIGFFVVLSSIFINLYRRNRYIAVILFFCLFVSWSFSTAQYNRYQKNEYIFYKHILDISPNNTDARFNLANYFLEVTKDFDEAEKQFKITLVSDPHIPYKSDVYFALGNVYFAKKEYDEAIKWYNKLLKYAPSAEAWNNLGLIYQNQGHKEAALNCFLTALKIKSESDLVYANLGLYYLNGGDYKKATVCINKAIELNPDNEVYFTDLGITYASQDLIKEASIAFNKALQMNPNSINTMFNFGNFYANTGHLDKAIQIWKKALVLDPNNETIKNNLRIAEGLSKK